MSKNGLHLITPTSIVSAGAGNSSSISANGSVLFSTCQSVSLNGVFSADYDNYMIVLRAQGSNSLELLWRMRNAGTDDSTASSYVIQYLYGNGASVSGGRETSALPRIAAIWNSQREGAIIDIYGPYLAQPTVLRTTTVESYGNGSIFDVAASHSPSTSYDGITLSVANSYSYSGRLAVYGLRK